MIPSHLQTRALVDALDCADELLATRATCLRRAEERDELAGYFSPRPGPSQFFASWAYTASEYGDVEAALRNCAPELLSQVKTPDNDRDFTVIGHCNLDLRFHFDPHGSVSGGHTLRDGTRVEGARVTSRQAVLFSNGLVRLSTLDGGGVYLFQPEESWRGSAAQLAFSCFNSRGDRTNQGLIVVFPKARTKRLPDYDWVLRLTSEDRLYNVVNHVSSGEAALDEKGFCARESHVVQIEYLSIDEKPRRVVIDGPFVAFFADRNGVHAAAWFDRDSFTARGHAGAEESR